MSREFHRIVHAVDVSKKSESENVLIIPNGKRLRLARFSGGTEYSTKEVRIELVHRTGGGDTLIATGYTGCFQYDIDADFVGDGTASIVIKHVNQDSGDLHMSGWWEGTSDV